jgi:hypothetical protein
LRPAPAALFGSLVVSLLVCAAGCSSQYGGSSVAQQVESWATTSPDPKFASAISTLQGDLERALGFQGSADEGVLRTDCDVLVTDALSANQNLPTPDSTLTAQLSGAYSSAVGAGQDCFCAAGGHPCSRGRLSRSALLARFAKEASHAQHGFIEAQARVDEFSMLSRQRRT